MRSLILLAGFACLVSAQSRIAVWIDTDPSVARGGHEVDDGIALLQAFASPELDIRGISIVFGNTDLITAGRIGREIVRRFGPKRVHVYNGAANAGELGRETGATQALARELDRTRLTILALGPATNVATVVRNHPALVKRIDQVIAVAGRRPGQHFRSGPTQKVPFRDLNFELDPEAFRVLLASRVPLVLAPWEISSGVWLNQGDVQTAATRNPGMKWMLPATNDWLDLWKREFGANGFNPFDALALGFVIDRQNLECEPFSLEIEIGSDDVAISQPPPTKPYLVVRSPLAGQETVTYCSAAKPEFKSNLMKRLGQGAQ